jgi:hypothetical protein
MPWKPHVLELLNPNIDVCNFETLSQTWVLLLSGALIWPFRRQMTLSKRMRRIIVYYQRMLGHNYFLTALRVFVFMRSVMSDGLGIPSRMMGERNTTSKYYNCVKLYF